MKKLGKHKTIIPETRRLFELLSSKKLGIRVRPGLVNIRLPYTKPRIQISERSGCVTIAYRTKNSRQVFNVYGDLVIIKHIVDNYCEKNKVERKKNANDGTHCQQA